MTIRPVSTISFRNNYNQVNFEGRKKENTHRSMTNTLKSIPLATLIAMSPLVGNAQNKVEFARVPLANVEAITNNPADVVYYDTDGDPSNIEKVVLQFKECVEYKEKINGEKVPVFYILVREYDLSGLEVEDVTEEFKNGKKNNFQRYYVNADTKIVKGNVYTSENAELVERGRVKETKNDRLQINADAYDYLLNVLNGCVEPVVKKVTEDGDANELMHDLYRY